MSRLILVIILFYTFFNIGIGSLIFIALVSAFNLYILLCQFVFNNRYKSIISEYKLILTEEEETILKKYHLYFRYPFASKLFSVFASGVYILGIILVIWLLIHKMWIYAALVALNSLISALMRIKLNPLFVLHDAVERRKKNYYMEEMKLLDSLADKITSSYNKS